MKVLHFNNGSVHIGSLKEGGCGLSSFSILNTGEIGLNLLCKFYREFVK